MTYAAPRNEPAQRREWARPLLPHLLAGAGGLLFGVLTNLAQGWLPGSSGQIANSGAVWCVAAFTAGALTRRGPARAPVLAGLLAETCLVVGYYGYAEFGRDGMGSPFYPLVWLVLACVAGPLMGMAGHWWRRGRTPGRRIAGLAALPGVFGMEGIHFTWTLHYTAEATACFILLAVLPCLGRSWRERLTTAVVAAAFAVAAYGLVELPLNALSA
ncbi:DUF6518 family protein (plasmid) [Streptomyces sp. NBC_01420]|uniref:DUF6518 family protein n=1 Tax=Streptomyces sp. NBC_01420 TaxID=2903858 RepID=UPI002F90E367